MILFYKKIITYCIMHKDNWPDGLYLYQVYDDKESQLIYNYIDSLPYELALNRPVQHYGYKYEYTIKEPQTRKLIPTKEPPNIIKCMANALYTTGMLQKNPNQYIVNKYRPGEGIGQHRDHHPIFDYDIATLSLGSPIVMTFRPYPHKGTNEKLDILLPIGSILVFGGEARYNWSHEIAKRKTDILNNTKIKRGDRISITFRRARDEYIEKVDV